MLNVEMMNVVNVKFNINSRLSTVDVYSAPAMSVR